MHQKLYSGSLPLPPYFIFNRSEKKKKAKKKNQKALKKTPSQYWDARIHLSKFSIR